MEADTKRALEYASRIAYSSEAVLKFSFDQARKYKDIPNTCMVEAGVAAGAQIIALMAGSECKVPIYALDSWDGIPLASNKDDQAPGLHYFTKAEQMALPDPGKQVLVSSGATVVPLEDFWNHICNAFDREDLITLDSNPPLYYIPGIKLITCKGWFEETLPTFECPPISILRLDSDLYNSTYVCLQYLYPKVIKGGLVIVDDWALPGCRQAVMDYFLPLLEGDPMLSMEYIKDENSTVAFWTK